ncbi:MAG TPA: flagellar motor protein MotB [Acidobacteriota bacterium]|nr:flagellar motor protein MotB [Acidobacteriota bacterium]
MAEHNGEQPIIIRRKRRSRHGAHGGAWKVALADFMTALMAFFLVMWMVGQKDDVREAVAGYFRNPAQFSRQGKSGVLEGSASAIKLDAEEIGLVESERSRDSRPSSAETTQLSLAAKKMLQELSKQDVFDKLKKNIKVHMTSEGLRIILNESEDSPAFFEPGSAKLLQKSAIILVTIAKELGTLKNRLVVEGHTDVSYTGQKDYTNWELSADRANSARQLMEVSGLWDRQVLEVRGFADQFPMIQNDPTDSRNRRVTIVVLYESRERQYDQIEVGADLMAEIL